MVRPIVPEMHQQIHNKHNLNALDGYWSRVAVYKGSPLKRQLLSLAGRRRKTVETACSPTSWQSPAKDAPRSRKQLFQSAVSELPCRETIEMACSPLPAQSPGGAAPAQQQLFGAAACVSPRRSPRRSSLNVTFDVHALTAKLAAEWFRNGQRDSALKQQIEKPYNTNRYFSVAEELLARPRHEPLKRAARHDSLSLANEVLESGSGSRRRSVC